MKKLNTCWWSLATLTACGYYVFLWFRHDLADARTLVLAVVAGVIALAATLYSLVNPTAHHRVTRILLGGGALVATFCAGGFILYSWTERARLLDMGILGFLAFCSALALGAAALAWAGFWRCNKTESCERANAAEPGAAPNGGPAEPPANL